MNDKLQKLMNEILFKIEEADFLSTSKDTSEDYNKAIDRLRAYGLIEKFNKSDWRLTSKGLEAVELGNIESYLKKYK